MRVTALRGWRGPAVAVLAVVTVLVLVLGLLGRLPGQSGPRAAGSGATTGSTASNAPTSTPTAAGPVLEPVSATGPMPTTAGLTSVLRPLYGQDALGPHVGAAVFDLASGGQLYSRDSRSGYAPASTTKLLTATAALATLGASYRIATTVVAGRTPGQVVLVGGGDPTLATAPPPGFVPAPASLPDLARQTAAALKASGTTKVTLGYDTSLFSGSQTSPAWPSTYVSSGVVAPVVSLMVDEGRVGLTAEGTAPRVPDPALGAAKAFARQLAKQGITVTGAPAHVVAPTGGQALATVRSPELGDLLGWMLSTSDNDLAEALARQVAIRAGEPADFPGGIAAVDDAVAKLGVPTVAVHLFDGSGLAPSTRVPPVVLGQLLVLAGSPDHPELRPLLSGLAVAGFTGSLEPPRFAGPVTTHAAGVVRGKTGTLTGVSAIAGTVDDADGRVLAFVFVADQVPVGATLEARSALDRLAAVVAGCGCR